MVHDLQDQATRPIPGLVLSAARSWENLDHFRGDLGRKYQAGRCVMAERVGFEPTLPFRVNTLSKRAPSATRPSLPVTGLCRAR